MGRTPTSGLGDTLTGGAEPDESNMHWRPAMPVVFRISEDLEREGDATSLTTFYLRERFIIFYGTVLGTV